MRHLLISAGLLLAVLLAFTSAKNYYVIPTANTPCPKKGLSCSTLSQYAHKPKDYFASNSTLILLPGNHSLEIEFHITNTTTFSVIASYTNTCVTCSQSAKFTLKGIGVVRMKGLVLIRCMNNNITLVGHFTLEDCRLQGQGRNGTGLEINRVTSANIVRSSFSSFTGEDTWNSHGKNIRAGGAIITKHSAIAIYGSCLFTNNSVTGDPHNKGIGWGGAVFAESSNIILNNSTFMNNTVTGNTVTGNWGLGGAVYVDSKSDINIYHCTFINNIVIGHSGARCAGGAVYAERSNVTINSSTFNNNTAKSTSLNNGGTVTAEFSKVTMDNITFINNTVAGYYGYGGAVRVYSSNITMNSITFNNNTVAAINGSYGGAVRFRSCYITMNNIAFNNNTATDGNPGRGGAFSAVFTNVTMNNITFNNNAATSQGGSLHLESLTLNSTGLLDIRNNMAHIGGVLYAVQTTMYFSGNTTILNNYGSLYSYACNVTFMGHTNIMNNSYSTNTSKEGGALTAIQSEIVFTVTANLSYNTATSGGAISATQSKLYVYGDITVDHNYAYFSGGGIYAYQSELDLKNHTCILNNSAGETGGGMHVISSITRMMDHSKTCFVGNHAKRGGGAYLEMNSKLYIIKKNNYYEENQDEYKAKNKTLSWVRLEFTENSADCGGALYITDDTNSGTCYATPFSGESTISSECFIQGLALRSYTEEKLNINIQNTLFTKNSATEVGHEIYGGLLDRCTVNPYAEIFYKDVPGPLSAVSYIVSITNLNIHEFNDSTKMISSDPVRVCFCKENQPDCSYHPQPVHVKKGETFTVSLVAVDQVNKTISNTIIRGFVPLPASLGEKESSQKTIANESCTELKYSILSSRNSEVLSLYAKGPCKDIGISTANLTVYIEPCPVGFTNINQFCGCVGILLNKYISSCFIDNQTLLRKDSVWFSYVNTTDHPQSYILHEQCPFDYCRPPTESVYVNLTIPKGADAMCVFNRTNKLCGSCKDGHSLSLGSSRCTPCSNNWLALLIAFAIAGVALVAFILVCNLTVAVGTINGLIFYANIIAANQAIFLPFDKPNVLSIFISWLNLDFGFESCFYNGMDGYAKTWLQLVFPLYIISLVVAIIVICYHSKKFANLFTKGKDPIATLATLILLSYTKLIRTIIAALAFAKLNYSDGSHEMVWLIDANVPYFKGKHIPLCFTAVVIVIIAMAYALFLFGWQWINTLCPNLWITKNVKLNSFMDSYHNPYNKDHRYWIGLLLLVRFLLYVVSAVNVLGDPHINLLSINSAVAILFFIQVLPGHRITKRKLISATNNIALLNLIGFTTVTANITAEKKSQVMVAYTSTCITFITFLAILMYHTCVFVLEKPFAMIKACFTKTDHSTIQPPPLTATYDSALAGKTVTVTVVDPPKRFNSLSEDGPWILESDEDKETESSTKDKKVENEMPVLACVDEPTLTPVVMFCEGSGGDTYGDETTPLIAPASCTKRVKRN